MIRTRYSAIIMALALSVSACGTRQLYLVKRPDRAIPENSLRLCLAHADTEMSSGPRPLSEGETALLKGIDTTRFLWWGDLSGPRPVVNAEGNPGEAPGTSMMDEVKKGLADRYVLCLLQNGYVWPDEAWVKERFKKAE